MCLEIIFLSQIQHGHVWLSRLQSFKLTIDKEDYQIIASKISQF